MKLGLGAVLKEVSAAASAACEVFGRWLRAQAVFDFAHVLDVLRVVHVQIFEAPALQHLSVFEVGLIVHDFDVRQRYLLFHLRVFAKQRML